MFLPGHPEGFFLFLFSGKITPLISPLPSCFLSGSDGILFSQPGEQNYIPGWTEREESTDDLDKYGPPGPQIQEQGIPAWNGYYQTNAVDKPGYYLYVQYASGEYLTVSADGDPGDTCVFALAPLLDYAAKQDIRFYE